MNIYFIGEVDIFDDKDIKYCTIEEAYGYLKEQNIVSLDIETTMKFNGKYGDSEGLSPYLSKIVMFQIGTLERQYIIDYRSRSLDKLVEILENKDILKVGHNLKFEYQHILHNNKVRINNMYDTQIVEQILYCGLDQYTFKIPGKQEEIKRFSLEALDYIYLKKIVQKKTRLEFLKIGSKPFTKTQLYYGAEDIYNPLLIREKQIELIKEKQLESCVSLEMKFIPVLGDIEYKGMYFDKDKWLSIAKSKKTLWNKQKEVLNNYIIKYYSNSKFVDKQLDLFSQDVKPNIKWTSSKQVIEFLKLNNACPQEVSKSTKKLSYTVNAKILKSSLNDLNKDKEEHFKEFINNYLEFKELEQACTTFGEEFLKYINPITKRVHSNFKQILNTGRISSTNPNLQNIPSDAEYRECFIAPEGYNIVNCDYSGQETVVLANVSKEANIGKLIIEGGDMHKQKQCI